MHLIDLPDWAEDRGRAINAFDRLEPSRTALVNIDLQNVFMAPPNIYANPHALDLVEPINRLSAALRAAGGQVIWTRQTHVSQGPYAPPPWQYDLTNPSVQAGVEALQAGADGQALHPLMAVQKSDMVIDKYRYGALSCPAGGLARALAVRPIEMVVITGTLTNCCCESTAREVNMAGYKVIFVADATAAVTDAEHNAALLNLRINFADVKTTETVMTMIARSTKMA